MKQTYSNLFQNRLAAAINRRIELCREEIAMGELETFADYKFRSGMVLGLNTVLNELFEEVEEEFKRD